jgi:hypothetical protein
MDYEMRLLAPFQRGPTPSTFQGPMEMEIETERSQQQHGLLLRKLSSRTHLQAMPWPYSAKEEGPLGLVTRSNYRWESSRYLGSRGKNASERLGRIRRIPTYKVYRYAPNHDQNGKGDAGFAFVGV